MTLNLSDMAVKLMENCDNNSTNIHDLNLKCLEKFMYLSPRKILGKS